MRASLRGRGRHAPARARRQSSLRAFAQSVSRRALSAYCVPGPCWLLGLPWEPTRAHAELREERRSPLNPGRGAACHTRGCGPARPGPAQRSLRSGKRTAPSAADPYLPSPGRGNSDPSLVPTSSRFSPPSDAECNPCIFSDWSKKEKKKKKKLLYKTCLHEPWEGLLHKVLRGAIPWWGHCQPWAPQAVAFCLRNPRTSTELGMWHMRPASPG